MLPFIYGESILYEHPKKRGDTICSNTVIQKQKVMKKALKNVWHHNTSVIESLMRWTNQRKYDCSLKTERDDQYIHKEYVISNRKMK